jgi:hypothetical protein
MHVVLLLLRFRHSFHPIHTDLCFFFYEDYSPTLNTKTTIDMDIIHYEWCGSEPSRTYYGCDRPWELNYRGRCVVVIYVRSVVTGHQAGGDWEFHRPRRIIYN